VTLACKGKDQCSREEGTLGSHHDSNGTATDAPRKLTGFMTLGDPPQSSARPN
jgi:hypothetical protein